MKFYLEQSLHAYFIHPFEQLMTLAGQVFREQKGRVTQRVQIGNKYYFIKQHKGVGWKEICKNIVTGRFPVLSAKQEYMAIQALDHLQIDVPKIAAFGLQGKNPAQLHSFILLEELTNTISLEDFCRAWHLKRPNFKLKQKMIAEIARIARIMHAHGINHRDFYICHFLLDIQTLQNEKIKLFLIDLHRAQIRRKIPWRWQIKDLAGLYFSSKEIGLTSRDKYRFMQCYRQQKLRDIFNDEKFFWEKIKQRGEKLYCKHS